MRKCELCDSVARMYCESDQAVLCWDCDTRVHSANFLVSKHSRILLCQVCQCLTPWTGSGGKLGTTVSVCDSCVRRRKNPRAVINHEYDDENEEEEEEDDDMDDECESEDEGENQVVPLSFGPIFSSSSATSEESSGRNRGKQRDRNY